MRYMGGTASRRNGKEASAPQGNIQLPLDESVISHNAPQHPHQPPLLPISKLTAALAQADPATHPQMLRENLYPLVEARASSCCQSYRNAAGDGSRHLAPS